MFHYCERCAAPKMTFYELEKHYNEFHTGYGITYLRWKTDSRNPDNWTNNNKCIKLKKKQIIGPVYKNGKYVFQVKKKRKYPKQITLDRWNY